MENEARRTVDLNGEFRFKVDDKGRLSLPSKFHNVLSKDLVVTRDPLDQCLYVFETPEFNDWVSQLFIDRFGKYDHTNLQQRALRTKLKARAFDVHVDKANRIMLPSDQRTAVEIDRDVVLVGNTGYFEVWDAKRYDRMYEETDLGLLFS